VPRKHVLERWEALTRFVDDSVLEVESLIKMDLFERLPAPGTFSLDSFQACAYKFSKGFPQFFFLSRATFSRIFRGRKGNGMKRLKRCKGLLVVLLTAVGIAVVAGCVYEGPPPPPPPPPPGPVVEGYDYYYYPDEEVYFYPATGVYFWFGGGGWHSGRHLPRGIVLHRHVNVRLNTRMPYERHQEIRARYPRHEPMR